MFSIAYNRLWCKGCRICLNVCPREVFELEDTVDRDGYQRIRIAEEERCSGCMLCAFLCPDIALEVKKC
ncbi:MAG: 4Fe-4S dicluster domain-containing protein [Candidatus Thermoplasmatota archaeon]|nr:4Fe-4S dicluster domain-containing protein [Candidatus Thermoplasmatota archaeon]